MVGRWLSPSLGDTSEAVKSPPGSSGCRVHTFEERKFSVYYTRFTNKRRLIKGGRKQSGGGNKVLKSSPYWLKRIRKGGRVEEEGPFVGFFQLIVDRRSSLFSPQKYRVSSRSGSSSRGEGWQWGGGNFRPLRMDYTVVCTIPGMVYDFVRKILFKHVEIYIVYNFVSPW